MPRGTGSDPDPGDLSRPPRKSAPQSLSRFSSAIGAPLADESRQFLVDRTSIPRSPGRWTRTSGSWRPTFRGTVPRFTAPAEPGKSRSAALAPSVIRRADRLDSKVAVRNLHILTFLCAESNRASPWEWQLDWRSWRAYGSGWSRGDMRASLAASAPWAIASPTNTHSKPGRAAATAGPAPPRDTCSPESSAAPSQEHPSPWPTSS